MQINEIFTSIDGEVNYYGQGTITTFIRLQGCNMRCPYCDTPGAQSLEGGRSTSLFNAALMVTTPKVTITGGEPLLQKDNLKKLVRELQHRGKKITIETNGSYPIPKWHGVKWVADYKLHAPPPVPNLENLTGDDYIKFIIPDHATFIKAVRVYRPLGEKLPARFAFSAAEPYMDSKMLLDLMLEHRLYDVKLNVQIHKCIKVK